MYNSFQVLKFLKFTKCAFSKYQAPFTCMGVCSNIQSRQFTGLVTDKLPFESKVSFNHIVEDNSQ